MKILVACEFSGIVRDAFSKKGHDAWSCDLLPTESELTKQEGKHIQGDVLKILDDGWDLMIAHPPCTYLCSSGLHWNSRGKPRRRQKRQQQTLDALGFVLALRDAPIPRICIENPIGYLSTNMAKPDQYIQPYHYGHPDSKKTCLWLKNLPRLIPTNIVNKNAYTRPAWIPGTGGTFECMIHGMAVRDCPCPPIEEWSIDPYVAGGKTVWSNQTPSGQNKIGPSKDRWKIRSVTYSGIAEAMADQWG